MTVESKIVRKIVQNILDIKGLGNEWEMIEPDIKDEIEEEWEEIIRKHLAGSQPMTCTGDKCQGEG